MKKSHILGTSIKICTYMTTTRHLLENNRISQGAEESQVKNLTHDFCLQ